MPIGWLRQVEQRLQQPMNGGIGEQVLAAHDMGDAIRGIINGRRKSTTSPKAIGSANCCPAAKSVHMSGPASFMAFCMSRRQL
jgi:hypothetical protein